MPINPLIQDTEKQFLNALVGLLESQILTPEEAQKITQEFLKLVDTNDLTQFKTGLHELSTTHPDFKPVYNEFLKGEEQDKVDSVLNKMQTLMQNGNVDQALSVSQTATPQ